MGLECKDKFNATYKFSEKFTLTPYKKVYAINDTIKLEFKTRDKNLLDNITNSKITTDTTSFWLPFVYEPRYPLPALNDKDTLANVIIGDKSSSDKSIYRAEGNLFANFYADCNTAPYYLVKISFIPKKAGIYTLRSPASEAVFGCTGRVNKFPLSLISFTYDLEDCNKDIYLSIPESQRKDSKYYEELMDKNQLFAFKVQ